MSELDIARREAKLAAQQLSESWEEINLLYSIGEILGRTVNLDDAALTILTEISETVDAKRAAIFVHDAGSGLLRPIAVLGAGAASLSPIAIDDESSVAARVFRTRQPLLVPEGDLESPLEAPVRSGAMLSVPVMWTSPTGSIPLGVVTLSGRGASGRFTAGDQKLVAAIASQIGTAIQIDRLVKASVATERLSHEMQLAHDLQMLLLPSPGVVAPGRDVRRAGRAGALRRRRLLPPVQAGAGTDGRAHRRRVEPRLPGRAHHGAHHERHGDPRAEQRRPRPGDRGAARHASPSS